MRTIEAIDTELAAAKEELSRVEGMPAEVYSRIVGYYRSVRNWNRGKRQEFSERKMFEVRPGQSQDRMMQSRNLSGAKVLLFVRQACPACPSAKEAASKLGLPVEYVDADADQGLAKAAELRVMSTPTAIFYSAEGKELGRARDARSITSFGAQEQLEAVASL